MKRRMLELPTQGYQTWPSWLVITLASLGVLGFIVAGYFLAGQVLSFALPPLFSLTNGLAAFYLSFTYFLFTAISNMAWVKWVEQRPISSLGFFRPGWLKQSVIGAGIGMLMFVSAFVLTYSFGGVTITAIDLSWETLFFALTILPFWLLQGGTEELLTRGWLLPIIYKHSNLPLAIAISSSLFGLLHLGNDHVTLISIANIVLFGVFAALYTLKTDNLWGISALHGVWNFTQGNVFGVAVSGNSQGPSLVKVATEAGVSDWISGGDFGIEGSLFTFIVLLVPTLYLLYDLRLSEKTE